MIYQNQFELSEFSYKDAILTDGRSFSNHCHKELEIMHVRKGSIKIMYNQKIFYLNEGDIILVPPYVNHAFLSPEEHCERFVIEIDLQISDILNSIHKNNSTAYKDCFYHLNTNSKFWITSTYENIKGIIYHMHSEYVNKHDGWELAIVTLVNSLVLTALRQFPKCSSLDLEKNKFITKLQTALEYIGSNFDKKISLDECANIIGFSPTYFSKFFKTHMGITFQEYIKNSRIDKAQWLLIASTLSVTDICYQCGFSDMRIFNKIFKQSVGENPSSFRKTHY